MMDNFYLEDIFKFQKVFNLIWYCVWLQVIRTFEGSIVFEAKYIELSGTD